MAKAKLDHGEEKAFEIIETAISDLETLTRAFDLVNDICAELSLASSDEEMIEAPARLIN